jgi:hypothetical protein
LFVVTVAFDKPGLLHSTKPMAGYSGTPLVKKLGIKEGFNILIVHAPKDFDAQLDLPEGVTVSVKARRPYDFVLFFTKSQHELEKDFSRYSAQLNPAGMLWVSWPKKTSGVPSSLNENIVRDIGLAKGMVDVKVCAVDDVWSGLKFVFRLKDRPMK